jgi:hypothetical protein
MAPKLDRWHAPSTPWYLREVMLSMLWGMGVTLEFYSTHYQLIQPNQLKCFLDLILGLPIAGFRMLVVGVEARRLQGG